MNKIEKFKKENPEYYMYLVEKKFGNGKQLIKFFYNYQVNRFSQGFFAFVDNQKWLIKRHEIMQEVQNYLIENIGVIDDSVFFDNYYEDYGIQITLTSVYNNEIILQEYREWRKDQFPKICLDAGGVSYFDSVS
jgi:hypothetical protein